MTDSAGMTGDVDIERLLHDAEHAFAGADLASGLMKNEAMAAEMRKKGQTLLAVALATDPDKKHPAWALSPLGREP